MLFKEPNIIIAEFVTHYSYWIDLKIKSEKKIISLDISKLLENVLAKYKYKITDCLIPRIHDEVLAEMKRILENELKNAEIVFSKEYGDSEISEKTKNTCLEYLTDVFEKMIKSEIDYPTIKRLKDESIDAKTYLELCLSEKKL